MSNFRKYAWFHLMVCAITAVAVIVLLSVTGNWQMSMAGFALLSLLGFGEMYFQNDARRPNEDERDEDNGRKALIVAHLVFWVCFVAWGTGISLRFSAEGLVPLQLVAPMVFIAWWFVTAIRATTALILDQRQN